MCRGLESPRGAVDRRYAAGRWNRFLHEEAYAENLTLGGSVFYKPVDNIGNKSIPDYEAYASQFVNEIRIPGCPIAGRVFVGQRKEGFVVNLGEVFDLVNTNPAGRRAKLASA